MNKELSCLILALILTGVGAARGEGIDSPLDNVPAPKPPLIARTSEQSSWLITITPVENASGAASSAHAKTIRAQLWTKSGTALQCANEWSDGTQTEDTVVGGTKFAQSPDGKGVHQYSPRLDPRYHDFNSGDFEMLDWITPQHYVGAVSHAGERCYLYQTKGAATTSVTAQPHNLTLAELTTPISPTSVYVSMRTGLPVEIDDTSDKYAFQFGSPGELRMPEFQPPASTPPPAPVAPPPPKPKPKKTTSSTSKAAKKPDATEKKSAPDANADL